MRPGIGVNVIHALFIDPEANGRRIHGDPLEGIAVLPSPDVFGEVHGIVLVHALHQGLQDDAFRAFRDGHGGIMHRNAGFLQPVLVESRVVSVARKAAGLVHDDSGKHPLLRVSDHLLELWPVIGAAADGVVAVFTDNLEAVRLCPLPALAQLIFDGCFTLGVGGIPGIDHGHHGGHADGFVFQCGSARHVDSSPLS